MDEFTYAQYVRLLELLKECGYEISNYQDYMQRKKCVILRHDVDFCIESALQLAEIEARCGVRSTYFILLRTDFYNVASRNSQAMLQGIRDFGHELGLHFDEWCCPNGASVMQEQILEEANILSALCQCPIQAVSMHRPSKQTLASNLKIEGLINSYEDVFFRDFKYLSDSRMCWREPVEEIIRGGQFKHIHILTHPFWYHEKASTLSETVTAFVRAGTKERYHNMAENIRDFESIFKKG